MKPVYAKLIKIAALAAMVPALSHAVPVKFPECARNVRINHPSGGLGAFMNEDCSRLYVLPPVKSSLLVNGYVPDTNLQTDCSRLKLIADDSLEIEQVSRTLTKRLKAMAEQVAEIQRNLDSGLVPVGQTPETMEAKIDALVDKMGELRGKLINFQKQNSDKKIEYGREAGAWGKFVAETQMAELLQSYKESNPRLQVAAMPIDQGFFSMNETQSNESTASSMPAVLKLKSYGLTQIPLLKDPQLMLQYKDMVPGAAPDGSKLFNGAISGDIHLSKVGACALQKAIGSAPTFKAGDVKAFIAAGATYSYQVQVTRKHKISYNFKELVKQIHQQTKKGGFFNTSTLNSFVDQRSTGSWINFEVSSQDGRYEYSDQYIREVKKEFLDRALAQIVSIQTGSPAAVLALIEPGKNGAGSIGDELGKCPHLYCQIGAAGMKVLNSIFGSTTAVSNLERSVTGEMVETVTEKRMVPAYGTAAFE